MHLSVHLARFVKLSLGIGSTLRGTYRLIHDAQVRKESDTNITCTSHPAVPAENQLPRFCPAAHERQRKDKCLDDLIRTELSVRYITTLRGQIDTFNEIRDAADVLDHCVDPYNHTLLTLPNNTSRH